MGKSKSEGNETFVDFSLNGVDVHSGGFQPFEHFLVSEENVELFKIHVHTGLSSDPISSFLLDLFIHFS